MPTNFIHRCLLLLLLATSACVPATSNFYAQSADSTAKICAPALTNPEATLPLELSFPISQTPNRVLQVFTEALGKTTTVVAISPLWGREFIVTLSDNKVTTLETGKFVRPEAAKEIAGLAILLQNKINENNSAAVFTEANCSFSCADQDLGAQCKTVEKSVGVTFKGEQLQMRYLLRFELDDIAR